MSPSPIHVKELEVTHHQGKLWWLNVLGACLRVHVSESYTRQGARSDRSPRQIMMAQRVRCMSPSPTHIKELEETGHQGELWWLNVLGACLRVHVSESYTRQGARSDRSPRQIMMAQRVRCMSPSPTHIKELEETGHQGELWWLNVLGACLRVPDPSRSLN
ncbi:hypothetical protein J6590_086777 [Homalodisca vitripennis]|nr:hypothetical protein J6590_086777 [Homalodisca vitripennis]